MGPGRRKKQKKKKGAPRKEKGAARKERSAAGESALSRRKRTQPKFAFFPNFLAFFCVGLGAGFFVAYRLEASAPESAETPTPRPVENRTVLKEKSTPAPAPKPVVSDPRVQEEYFQRGFAALRRESWAEAFRRFTKAAELDPRDPRPHFGFGKIFEALDYHERAITAYRKAIEINPAYYPAKINLARILCDFGKNEESLRLLEEARRQNPKDPLIWAEIAVNELRLGRPGKAVPLLRRYNRAMGPQSWGYVHLGRALAETGQVEEAERIYRRALEIDPYNELGHLWLGQLLVSQGKREEAQPHFKRFRFLRNVQTKKRELEQAIARRPGNPRALVKLLVDLAHARHLMGQYEKALIPLRKALEIMPDDEKLKRLYESELRKAEESKR